MDRRRENTVRLLATLVRPVAAADVAQAVAEVSVGATGRRGRNADSMRPGRARQSVPAHVKVNHYETGGM